MRGAIHFPASHSGVGLVVTGTTVGGVERRGRRRAGRLGAGARNTSGGRVADDDSSAHVAPSGDGSIACAPRRRRQPACAGRPRPAARRPGDRPASASVDAMRNCLPSGVSCASVISQAPLVSCRGAASRRGEIGEVEVHPAVALGQEPEPRRAGHEAHRGRRRAGLVEGAHPRGVVQVLDDPRLAGRRPERGDVAVLVVGRDDDGRGVAAVVRHHRQAPEERTGARIDLGAAQRHGGRRSSPPGRRPPGVGRPARRRRGSGRAAAPDSSNPVT